MFDKITTTIRRWLSKMGIIKKVKNVSQLKTIPVDDSFYKLIDTWKRLYSGYLPEFHDVTSKTIDGQKKRKRATLNMAKVVSQELATIVFNEKCAISTSDEDVTEYIDNVLYNNNFDKTFQNYLEYQFAMGGMVIKPYVSDDMVKLSYVTADSFIPLTFSNKGIYEGVFINQTSKSDKIYTLLEWHYWENSNYIIKNELYESDKTSGELGVKVPLSVMYDIEEEVSISNLKNPLFVYFKPSTANHIDTSSPLGVSVFAHAMDTLKTLDIAYDSYQREFLLGKRRILVPATAIKTVVDPLTGATNRYFDSNDEVYEAFNMEQEKIHDNTVELRVEEHIAAINSLLNILAMQIGFNAGAFSFDGKSGLKTATEVVSENSKTFRTKQSHENVIEAGLIQLVESIMELTALYDLGDYNISDLKVSIAFDDSIAEDKGAEIEKQINLVLNGLTSRKRAIKKIHGVTDEEAEEILNEIREEDARSMPEYEQIKSDITFFGEEE